MKKGSLLSEWVVFDNTREWTGLEIAKSQRAVENREKWRKLVVKSCGAPTSLAEMMMMIPCKRQVQV